MALFTNIGNALSIIVKLMTNASEIEAALKQTQSTAKTIEGLVPQVTKALAEGQQVVAAVRQLIEKIAPELITAQEAAPAPTLDVKWLQTSLNTLINASLVVDGVYGNLTGEAVKEFQRRNGLTIDGWAGVNTQAKIMELLQQLGTP